MASRAPWGGNATKVRLIMAANTVRQQRKPMSSKINMSYEVRSYTHAECHIDVASCTRVETSQVTGTSYGGTRRAA